MGMVLLTTDGTWLTKLEIFRDHQGCCSNTVRVYNAVRVYNGHTLMVTSGYDIASLPWKDPAFIKFGKPSNFRLGP